VFISLLTFCAFIAGAQNSRDSREAVEEERWVRVSDTLTMDQLLDVAVKFFDVRLREDGNYAARLCERYAAHVYTQSKRDEKLERFCAGVIFENSQGENGLHSQFVQAVKEVSKMNLGLNKDEAQFRAQGALFMLMSLNPKLRDVLRSEYEKQKHMLHFYLLPGN